MYFKIVRKTNNKKTGPLTLISSSQDTCPITCPLKNNGCYGYSLSYLKSYWDKWSRGEGGVVNIEELYNAIPSLEGQIIRYGEVGDLPGDGIDIDEKMLFGIRDCMRKYHVHAFTYTHYTGERNRKLLIECNKQSGLIVNESFESLARADEAAQQGRLVTCTVPSSTKKVRTPSGYPAIICPAVKKEEVQCISCGGKNGPLCLRQNQKKPPIICFPAHGPAKKQIDRSL